MLGANRAFVKDTASTSNWFGFDLGYDKTAFTVNSLSKSYAAAQYNGNIGGMLWRSTGDDRLRKYDFTYDGANRILGADFNQFTNTSFSKDAGIDFSMTGMSYDANGNILSMNQRGWKPGGSQTIDSLLYTYTSNTNKLLNVLDRKNDTTTRLGDFRSSKAYMDALSNNKTTAATDYSYDVNGNLTQDKNKDIGNIHYNYLNLPDSITVTGKGKIIYQYDASGAKLKKVTTEGSKVTTTLYLGGAVFQNDTMQFLAQEEGRIRRSDTLVYDYMLKDHLGNVRMLLTTEKKTDMYPAATMETAQATTEEALYANLPETRVDVPTGAGYPANTPSGNLKVAKVGAGSGLNKIGPSIMLKVMAGDTFNVKVNSWWKSTNTPSNTGNPLSDLLAALNGGIGGITAGHGGPTVAQLTTSNALSPSATSFLNSQSYTSGKPKAYLNWVLLDEQFNYVAASSGFEQVGASNAYTPHNKPGLSISKNGYLYIYVSNVTDNIDVFFDNLQVTHVRGPLLEETHYYPFGLTMAGISDKAIVFGEPQNQKKYNGIEKEDDLQIEVYDAQLRELDGQVGRWWEIDPVTDGYEDISPYASMYNNPLHYSDPTGNEGEDCCWDAIKSIAGTLLISGSGLMNGALNTLSFGLISSDPFNFRNTLSDEQRELYDNSVQVGKVGPLIASAVGELSSPSSTPMVQPILGPPVSVPTSLPLFPVVVPMAGTQQSSQEAEPNKDKKEDHGGGKNGQHSNQKARESAKERYDKAKDEYDKMKSKPNKTKEDKAQLEKLQKQVKHEKNKMDNTGENHSQKAKGSN